jgi:TetR/AcrR family transcriptional repressor of bet genes
MEPLRRRQLIEATISVVAEVGLQATTISLISKKAGLSSGIISHYFGGKQGLIEATVRYLLETLRIKKPNPAPRERLMRIVDLNFSDIQQGHSATKIWLSFWAQSMHDPALSRLQEVNKRRLVSNLRFSFKQLMDSKSANDAAEMTAALIDGFWLRCALSRDDTKHFEKAKQRCKHYIDFVIRRAAH